MGLFCQDLGPGFSERRAVGAEVSLIVVAVMVKMVKIMVVVMVKMVMVHRWTKMVISRRRKNTGHFVVILIMVALGVGWL